MAWSQASLSLFPAEPVSRAAPPPGPERRPIPRALWLCLAFHRLPLEVFGPSGGQPVVVLESDGGGRRVVAGNTRALGAGVAPGLSANAALVLAPGLVLLERDPGAEARALCRLAAWAGQFSSRVSLEPPARLLVEIRGSLRLFGGLERLLDILAGRLAATGHKARRAVAPTPRAALWLAMAHDEARVTAAARLPGALAALPLACTGWPARTLQALEEMGATRVGDCLRLPRDGFARRLGSTRLADLDRALGRLAEPRRTFRPPARYRGELALPAETLDRERLREAAGRLLAELEGFLVARQAGVERLRIGLHHAGGEATRLCLGLGAPTARAALMGELLAHRLERTRLPAPVVSLTLDGGRVTSHAGTGTGLFRGMAEDGPAAEEIRALVDRLRARLGEEAVRGLCLLPEHRPEAAWRYAEPGTASTLPGHEARPFWILERPAPLAVRQDRPWLDGPLALLWGPERIETGWWDGRDAARDYYEAEGAAGARLWIYRDRRSGRWSLHGMFG